MYTERECVSTTNTLGFSRPQLEYLRVVETVSGPDSSEGRMIVESKFSSSVNGPQREYYHESVSAPVFFDGFALEYTDMGSDEAEFQNNSGSVYGNMLTSRTVYADQLDANHICDKSENSYTLFTTPATGSESGDYLSLPAIHRSIYHERYVARMSPYVEIHSVSAYGNDHSLMSVYTETRTKNSLGRTSTISTTASDGSQETVSLTYNSTRPAFLESSVQRTGSSVSGAVKYDYGTFNISGSTAVLPKLVYRGCFSGGSTVSYVPEMYIDAYDAHANPVQTRDAAGNKTAWLWGYGGQYLAVKAEGIGYSQACYAWNVSSAAQDAYSDKLTQMRGATGIMVNSWTWKPLVGMLSCTDPSGRTETYGFDSEGRLVSRGKEAVTLQTWQYNLAHKSNL